MNDWLYWIIAIVVMIVISIVVKWLRKFVPEKQLERACDTLKEVEVENVCVFCGKALLHNVGWKQKMHREIKCESTLRGQETTYENIEISIPCCQECAESNRVAEKQADKKAMTISSCLSAVGTVFLLLWSWQCGDIKDKWFGVLFVMFFVWCLLSVFFRWLFRPLFEKQISECSIVGALFEKGWGLGESPGVKTGK
jgi:hypothetical protein